MSTKKKKRIVLYSISSLLAILFLTNSCFNLPKYFTFIRDTSICRGLRVKTLKYFSDFEKGKNKLDIISKFYDEYPNTYTSKEYSYQISYPDSWEIREYEYEGFETIELKKIGSGQYPNKYTSLIIGLPSGSVCANMGCDYNAGKIYVPQLGKIILTKGYVFKKTFLGIPIGTTPQYYGFYFSFDSLKPTLPPFIKGYFNTPEDGQEVVNILSTIKIQR